MDYVLGGVAALITGNVTPNRPRALKKALTPTKHQPSPDVTPKSELVNDRSIFLSPTLQKKKAIVKKSPKRIFQNPDMDITENDDSTLVSPKADKVKKHLKDDLEVENHSASLKLKSNYDNPPTEMTKTDSIVENKQQNNENTPKKRKKNKDSSITIMDNGNQIEADVSQCDKDNSTSKSPKKMKKKRKSLIDDVEHDVNLVKNSELVNKNNVNKNNDNNNQQIIQDGDSSQSLYKKKSKKRKHTMEVQVDETNDTDEVENVNVTNHQDEKENEDENVNQQNSKNLNRKNKKRNKKQNTTSNEIEIAEIDQTKQDTNVQLDNIDGHLQKMETDNSIQGEIDDKVKKKKPKKKAVVNPNAVTDKDSESEHDSDDDIESESEQINKELLEKDPVDSSSDEEKEEEEAKPPVKKEIEKSENYVNDPNELKRTLFVGNVPFSKKCKKEIKRIFSKYGQIETVRIRTVPIKDARDTPKLAIIKNELHPDRSTVNVYVKFADQESVEKALVENNTVLNDNHLRVSRSDSTGAEHDPRCSIFVGNMPFALEDEALRAKFENCGEIDSVRIIRDRKTNAGKGFGYVNFKSKDGVELALALSEEDLTIKNRILRVKRCTQGTQRQNNNRFNQRGNRTFGSRDQGNNRQVGNFSGQPWNESDGAYRRVMNKRKHQQEGSSEGPANKRQNTIQPRKEKKSRKEFVGMTAEKRKRHKFDKGQKKKKMLSEILTK